MAFAEDLAVFFNADEFGALALINGKVVAGYFSYGTVLVNDVETHKPIFTCAEAEVSTISHGSLVQIQQQNYRVIGIKTDGTGIVSLILEQANDEV